MQVAPCGNCGMQSEICMDGAWQPSSACLNQGECAVGAVETMPVPACGEEQRLCQADCSWSVWSVTVPPGECVPATTRLEQLDCPTGTFRHQTCNDLCMWITEADPCMDLCGGMPRVTTNADEEDVCIPAGDFIRGQVGLFGSEPVTTVTLSAYYIDRYTVTNRRYKACRDAGACANPSDSTGAGLIALENPALAEHWVRGVTWNDAVTFCGWDGARRLVTEAEWEKAARGPSPRTHVFPAFETTWDCVLLPRSGCPGVSFTDMTDEFDSPVLALDSSFYGVIGMATGGKQWTHDWWSSVYYSEPASLIDPQGPSTGIERTIRGKARKSYTIAGVQVSLRNLGDPAEGDTSTTIRCGRAASGL
jgi:formylglycine-generating enzyme required for sulfatase activity